jgi:hypothetical protein
MEDPAMSFRSDRSGPRLYRRGGIEIDIGVADPSVTLVEVGDEMGLVLSESCDDNSVDARLVFENVLWARGFAPTSLVRRLLGPPPELAYRELERVEIYRHDDGPFVVQDSATRLYLPYPSIEPYIVVFISDDEYRSLAHEIRRQSFENLLDGLEIVMEGVPDVEVVGSRVIGPETQMHGVRYELDQPLMSID